jgi:hypothetical protein
MPKATSAIVILAPALPRVRTTAHDLPSPHYPRFHEHALADQFCKRRTADVIEDHVQQPVPGVADSVAGARLEFQRQPGEHLDERIDPARLACHPVVTI